MDDFLYYMTEFEGNAKFIFLCNPQRSWVKVSLIKLLKKAQPQKSNCMFL